MTLSQWWASLFLLSILSIHSSSFWSDASLGPWGILLSMLSPSVLKEADSSPGSKGGHQMQIWSINTYYLPGHVIGQGMVMWPNQSQWDLILGLEIEPLRKRGSLSIGMLNWYGITWSCRLYYERESLSENEANMEKVVERWRQILHAIFWTLDPFYAFNISQYIPFLFFCLI